jgi:chitinase
MYAYSGRQWVGYDNEATMNSKVDLVNSRSLGGVMLWALDLDDFKNSYPLLTAVNNRLRSRRLRAADH